MTDAFGPIAITHQAIAIHSTDGMERLLVLERFFSTGVTRAFILSSRETSVMSMFPVLLEDLGTPVNFPLVLQV